MKRTLAALILAASVLMVPAATAGAVSTKKPCATFGIGTYPDYSNHNGASPPLVSLSENVGPYTIVNGQPVQTTTASCKGVNYVATVYDTSGTILASQSYAGDGSTTSFSFSLQVASPPPSTVCVTTSTQDSKGAVIDLHPPSGPSNGCTVGAGILYNGGSGGNYWL